MLIPIQLRQLEPRQSPDPTDKTDRNDNSLQGRSGGGNNNAVIIVSRHPSRLFFGCLFN